MKQLFNPKGGMKPCAFCKHWYDPTNSVIQPKAAPFWEYDTNEKRKCLARLNVEMPASASCPKYECKI